MNTSRAWMRLRRRKASDMAIVIKKATRTGVKPLIGIYGKSGGGKTLTALFVARGLVGPTGRIVLIDTESGRGSLFADVVPGGYEVIELSAPFSPEAFTEAINLAESKSDVVLVDSISHEWSGEGGVIDMQEAELDRMAGTNWSKREACKMAAWIKPKMAHKRFISRLLQIKVPLICCLRGEEKTHIAKGSGNDKTKVVTDEFSTPLFDQRFIFELLINFEAVARKNEKTGLMEGGYVIPRKITHPSVAQLLPGENEQLGIEFGKSLSAWCSASGSVATGVSTAQPDEKKTTKPEDPLRPLKAELWALLKDVRAGDTTAGAWNKINEWLWKNSILSTDGEACPILSAEKFADVIAKTRIILGI